MEERSITTYRENWLRIKILLRSSVEKSKNYKKKSIVWMIQGASRTLNQYAVDNYPTFPVNSRFFLFLFMQEDCLAAPETRSLIFWNTHGKLGNVSCKFTCVLFSTLLENNQFTGWPNCGQSSYAGKYGNTRSWNEWSRQTQFLLRDFHEVRRPEFNTTLRREEISRIWDRHKDFKSRNFTLTNSLLHKRFRVGKRGSTPECALVQISLRKQCYGSKK